MGYCCLDLGLVLSGQLPASVIHNRQNECIILVMRIKFDHLIQPQIDTIESLAHFTRQQKTIFRLLCSGEYTDAGDAMQSGMSLSSYYRIKTIIIEKIEKLQILKEK